MGMNTVAANVQQLISYNRSMAVALEKAENGSEVEDMYFMEKLCKTASMMGYKLVSEDVHTPKEIIEQCMFRWAVSAEEGEFEEDELTHYNEAAQDILTEFEKEVT